jgi:hypothetical protein
MKTQDIFKKVGTILSEVNEQYEYLSAAPENLNDLELELLSANADFLAEHIKVLKKLNLATAKVGPVVEMQEPGNSLNAREIAEPFPVTPASDLFIKPEDPLTKQPAPESYFSFQDSIEHHLPHSDNDDQEEVDVLPQDYQVMESEPVISHKAMDVDLDEINYEEENNTYKLSEEELPRAEFNATEDADFEILPVANNVPLPTLNELMAAKLSKNQPIENLNRQTVSDLKSIINLNDKLLFIKDLFNGYSLAYSEAIEILNRFDSFDAADNFLKTNYASKNNWASKQATADKFYELLNRRFSI